MTRSSKSQHAAPCLLARMGVGCRWWVAVVLLGLGCGDPGDGSDAGVDATSRVDAGSRPCEVHPDCPDGSYCRPDADGHSFCVTPGPDPVPCDQPFRGIQQHGDRCDPSDVPPGHTCRLLYCNSGCYPTCDCVDGRWSCADACIDWAAPGAAYCGRPPLCVAFSVCVGWDRSGDVRPCLADFDCPDGETCGELDAGVGRCAP